MGITIIQGGGSSSGGSSSGGSGTDPRWNLFLPSAPTNFSAIGGNAQATLSWSAPTGVIAQAPITGYSVEYTPSGGSPQVVSTGSTAASYILTGLTNDTAYAIRAAAVNAVGIGAYSASAAVTPAAITPDPLFQNVSMLLHMNGIGSAFTDSSATPVTITAFGNATQSATQSKWGSRSAYFDGTGDYVRSNPTSAVQFDQGDYCIEFWLYITAAAANHAYGSCLFDTRYDQQSYASGICMFLNSSGVLTTIERSAEAYGSASGVVPFSQWAHIALARSSMQTRAYVNGSSVLSYTDVASINGSQLTLGAAADHADTGSNFKLTGYIDDFRVTKGVARYTGATLQIPIAAFPDSGPISAPTSLTATGGNAQVSLAWTAPSYNGGSAITDYSVQFSSNSGSTWSNFSRTASTTASQVVTGLTNGTAYVFRVAGINANGTGTYTAASSSVTPSAGATVTGGAVLTPGDGYVYRTFTSSGDLTISGASLSCDILVVGGGGSGGGNGYWGGGGGGGGGVLLTSAAVLSAGTYPVVVAQSAALGSNGNSSSISSFSASGGLVGVGGDTAGGGAGGSSGLPTSSSSSTRNAGGSRADGANSENEAGGGGGGAGGAGQNATAGNGGLGGVGRTVFGLTYGAGGRGGFVPTSTVANGSANTGNGGSGAREGNAGRGTGGSGVVVIRYLST